MQPSTRKTLRVALAALIGSAGAGGVLYAVARIAGQTGGLDGWWWASLTAAALAGGLAAAVAVRRSFAGRIGELSARLDARMDGRELLARLPEMGDDEIGRIAAAVNRLLERITALQGDVIDRSRELESTQRDLALAEELAEKQRELEARLRERALLFDVLRESAASHDLDRVLAVLVERVADAMRLSRLAVLLRDERGRSVVRAAHGLDVAVLGQRVRTGAAGPWSPSEGVQIVPDLSRAPEAVGFWDALPAEGSYASVPIRHAGERIGILVMTRPASDPLGELEGRYLEAVAAQAALAIHNAQLVARLEALSTHDELTGLPNRRLFARRLERALARADRYGHPVSVLALDLDHFKQLNDRCGHPAGDAALRAVADVLRESLRAVDTAARVGGEELWVLLPETDGPGATEVAEKLRRRVAALHVEGASTQPLGHLSVSIGVATRRPGETAEAILERADDALYDAKRSGRDRVASVPPAA